MDARPVEVPLRPDEQWKADPGQPNEHSLDHMIADARTGRDTILDADSSESSHEPSHREYEESMGTIQTFGPRGVQSQVANSDV